MVEKSIKELEDFNKKYGTSLEEYETNEVNKNEVSSIDKQTIKEQIEEALQERMQMIEEDRRNQEIEAREKEIQNEIVEESKEIDDILNEECINNKEMAQNIVKIAQRLNPQNTKDGYLQLISSISSSLHPGQSVKVLEKLSQSDKLMNEFGKKKTQVGLSKFMRKIASEVKEETKSRESVENKVDFYENHSINYEKNNEYCADDIFKNLKIT
jgi:hypothetical protein